jgi:Holliday junction resolvasome RuvABC endonuclease subunit
VKTFSILKNVKILGIDPSTRSLAWALCTLGGGGAVSLGLYGKIELPHKQGMEPKINAVVSSLPGVIEAVEPDFVYIEQTVYIQNYQTSRDLSYVVGASMATSALSGVSVCEASPLVWKVGIGYKKVMKADIARWTAETSEKEAKKRAAFERKNRVREILVDRFSDDLLDTDQYDHDIIDAIGIALWGCQKQDDKNHEGLE